MKSIPKDQWPDWIRARLGARKNVLVRETNGRYYLYKSKSHWDKKLKQPRTRITYVGRLKEYGDKVREHGHVALLMHLMEKHKVLEALKECFPSSWKELLLFSLDRVVMQSPLKRVGSWAEKTTLEKTTGAPLGKKLSRVLAKVGVDSGSQKAFMQDMMKSGDLLLYDGSVIYSTSGYNKLLEVGHDKGMSYEPKVNISLLFSKKRNVPVHFRLFFGSVHEIKTMDRIAHEMRDHDIMFIADKGFYKNALFKDLDELGIGFIIPLPRDDKRIEYSRKCRGVFGYRGRAITSTHWKAGDYWIYHFEDPFLKGVETSKYLQLKLEKKRVTFHEEWAGRISLLSNRKLSPKQAYLLWKSRDRIEKAFHILQNRLELDKPYVSNEDVFRGYLFASFISLIAYYLVLNLIQRRKLNDRVSVDDVMFEFSKIAVEGGRCPTFAEIPAKVRKLAEELGVWDIVAKI
jgi:hypothetical protein